MRGQHVTMTHHGRMLLGEVTAVREHGEDGEDVLLTVRHFNGEPWPRAVRLSEVEVLKRTYEEEGPE